VWGFGIVIRACHRTKTKHEKADFWGFCGFCGIKVYMYPVFYYYCEIMSGLEMEKIKEKIKEILDAAFRDERSYGYGIKLLFYGEPHTTWIPTDYPPKMERVRYYPHVVCTSIIPIGGRLRVEVSEGASPSVHFFETWKQAFDYVAEEVARLCNYSISKVEVIHVTSEVIWRRD